MNAIYERIARLCTEKGMSINRACIMAEVNPARISTLKKDDSRALSIDTLQKLSKTLNTTPEFIQYGTDPKILIVDENTDRRDMSWLVFKMETQDIVRLMSHCVSELQRRTLPDFVSVADLPDDEIVHRISDLSRELTSRNSKGGHVVLRSADE